MHYKAYDEPGNVPHFLPLVIFVEDRVPTPLVICAEAIMVLILNTLARPAYWAARQALSYLPWIPSGVGLNQESPFVSNDLSALALARHKEHREAFLDNALNGGLKHVRINRDKHGNIHGYSWTFFYAPLHIPIAIGREWRLEDSSTINVRYDLDNGRHPHLYARSCGEEDDGRHLGIEISKEVGGVLKRHWVQKKPQLEAGRKVANSITDFLLGRVVDAGTHEWGDSRFPLMGRAAYVNELETRDRKARKDAEERAKSRAQEPGQTTGPQMKESQETFRPRKRSSHYHMPAPTKRTCRAPREASLDNDAGEDSPDDSDYFAYLHAKYSSHFHRDMFAEGICVPPNPNCML